MTANAPALSRRTALLLGAAGLGAGALPLTGCDGDDDLATVDIGREAPAAVPNDDTLTALGDFAGVLAGSLAAGDGNLICSPLSAQIALAMTRNGAEGRTAEEMDEALRFPPLDRLNPGLNTTMQLLEQRSGRRAAGKRKGRVTLDLADRVYGEQTFTWLDPFLTALARYYGTGVARTDFRGDPGGSRRRMNDWVADQTHEKIKDLLPSDVITTDTRMVLLNAVYLAAPWQQAFDKVGQQDFRTGDGRTVEAAFMRSTLRGRVAQGQGWQAAEIPYLGGELAMTVVLPSTDAAMPELLGDGLVTEVLSGLAGSRQITVTMPMFRFRTTVDLTRTLSRLGMPTAFTDAADFSGMTDTARLRIAHVLQQGWIAVDEQGTEAAAATAVVMEPTSADRKPVLLVLDRPFWFIIHDRDTLVPIMVGRVSDPTAH